MNAGAIGTALLIVGFILFVIAAIPRNLMAWGLAAVTLAFILGSGII